MSGSVVVVVIVGVVVCAIAMATVRGKRLPLTGAQPATAWRPVALAGDPPSSDPSGAWTPPSFGGEPDPGPWTEPGGPVPLPRRLRAVTLLTASVVLLGAAAAALIGATALIVVQIADKALGP